MEELKTNNIHLIKGDCLDVMRNMNNEYIDCLVTSPPYYNAREYSQWTSVDDYMREMKCIFSEVYRILKNHKYIVINVGDVTCQVGNAKWSVRKLPLGAMFTMMLEEIGFQFIDDYIWDKGEPQSKRHLGNPQYPFYQYPVNCYEHILIFVKHEVDKCKIPCPVCNKAIVVSNSQSGIGVQSWECKNPNCAEKSKSGRGKRFSKRSIMMNDYQIEDNYIEKDFIKKWRRDIVKINPIIKINNKGVNLLGHTAPFPLDIPEMAIRYFTGIGDTVMDCFLGSGTSGVVAKKLNRKFIGIELNDEYFDVAYNRINGYIYE